MSTPPMMLASMGSRVRTRSVRAKRSTKAEDRAMPSREPSRKSSPKCRQAMRNRGMFITITMTPMGQWVKVLTIMAMPVTPPATMLLGKRKA